MIAFSQLPFLNDNKSVPWILTNALQLQTVIVNLVNLLIYIDHLLYHVQCWACLFKTRILFLNKSSQGKWNLSVIMNSSSGKVSVVLLSLQVSYLCGCRSETSCRTTGNIRVFQLENEVMIKELACRQEERQCMHIGCDIMFHSQ